MKLSQAKTSQAKHVLVFGGPKTGKSLLVGKLAEKFNLIWFDLEAGSDTLFQLPLAYQERITLVRIPDTRSFPIAIQTCLKVIRGNQQNICEEHGSIECAICKKSGAPFESVQLGAVGLDTIVVFDSLTQLTNSAISHITRAQPEDYKLQYEDWGNLGKLMDTFLSQVQQAPFHVVCISHETETEMEDGKVKLVPTAGTRNFSRNTAKYFGEVIYADLRNKVHKFASATNYAANILTGSRSNQRLEDSVEASLIPIFDPEWVAPKAPTVVAGTANPAAPSKASALLDRLKNK